MGISIEQNIVALWEVMSMDRAMNTPPVKADMADAALESTVGAQPPRQSAWLRVRRAAAMFWLEFLFRHGIHRPWFIRLFRGPFLFFAWHCAPSLRDGTLANARWLLGPGATAVQRRALGKAVIDNFCQFVYDLGRSVRMTRQQILDQIEQTVGQQRYDAARQMGKGAIIVTAHLGSFEVGVASLSQLESVVHVVYHRDVNGRFEQLRSTLRRRWGVVEAPIEDGWPMWLRLRDALKADQVVLIQGDRVMPGQKGIPMPFLGGHMMIPTGPIKLALASGAPMIPIFSVRAPTGKIRIYIEDPITVEPDGQPIDQHHPAMVQLTSAIERYVQAYPEQWLVLYRAWCEDAEPNGDHP